MRILMLSANIGEGHNSSARAVVEVLEQRGAECLLLDSLSFLSPSFSKFISDWHVRIYQHGGNIFDKGYRFMENVSNPDNFNPIYELMSLGAGKLRDTVMEMDVDAVVCTHPFAGIMITEARKSWGLELPTFLIATDYTCTPTAEQCKMDLFFVPAPEISEEFRLMGIDDAHQCVCGIPVRQVFYAQGDRALARRELGLPEDATVVLVMCGSMGCGPIQTIAQQTLEQMGDNSVMIALCGRNQKLKAEMEQIEDPKLRVVGFIDDFYRYLDAADLIVTKPGGLSSTEAANKHVPMVFINTVGGCESRNFDHFLHKGYAVGSCDPEEVVRIAIRMVWDREGRERLKENLRRDFCSNTGQLIAERIVTAAEIYRSHIME